MLQRINADHSSKAYGSADQAKDQEFISLREIAAFFRRRALTILAAVALFTAAGTFHVMTAVPLFSARAQLVIDPDKSLTLGRQMGEVGVPLDNAQVESQIEFLRSERIAAAVIDNLNLDDDPEFGGGDAPQRKSLSAQVRELLFESQTMSPGERRSLALSIFSRKLSVRRVGQSYLIEVVFTSVDPEKAAAIANATAEAYIADRVRVKSQAAVRSGTWLETRIAELRQQLNDAARAVQEFRAENNIVDTGSRGLLDDQQLSELNTQAVMARVRTAETRARLDRIEEIMASGVPDAAVVEVLGNQVVNVIRERMVAASNREAELVTRYGANHPAILNVQSEIRDYRRALLDELHRISETYKSDYEVARVREAALAADLNALVSRSTETKKAQIKAAELETVAQTYRRMYESYLQNLADSVQKASYSDSDARIIAPAAKPLSKSYPQSKLLIIASVLLGSAAGIGVAILQQSFDRGLYSSKQVRQALGTDCLGLVPSCGRKGLPLIKALDLNVSANRPRHGLSARSRDLASFLEGVRDLKTSVELARSIGSVRCIGISSLGAHEGKSTIASNLARMFAFSGTSTILIDGDIASATTSKALAPQSKSGLLSVLNGDGPLEAAVVKDDQSPLHVLPIGAEGAPHMSRELLGSNRMREVLGDLAGKYQLVIVDLPALQVGSDARAISPFVESFVLVGEWGRTSVDALQETIHLLAAKQISLLGVVINKIDHRAMRKMREHGDTFYV